MSASAPADLLDVTNLHVTLRAHGAREAIDAVSDVSFHLAPGDIVGLVGESGSGKTITAMSLLKLLPRHARTAGQARLRGRDLLDLDDAALRSVRGEKIGVVYQEPMTALDPVIRIGEQISETIRAHRSVSRRDARERTLTLLERVGIPDPKARYDFFPHQLSGGMQQRVVIAIALSCDPELLIADEPTTALDVTVQAQILELLQSMSRENTMSILLISHNLGVVAQICQRVIVLYAGEVVEDGPIDDVLFSPAHPYTAGLLAAVPLLTALGALPRPIPGRLPPPGSLPRGCRFAPRCPHAEERCRAERQVLAASVRNGRPRSVRCRRSDELRLSGAGG